MRPLVLFVTIVKQGKEECGSVYEIIFDRNDDFQDA